MFARSNLVTNAVRQSAKRLYCSESAGRSFKLACCQLAVGADKHENLANARKMVSSAVSQGAQVVVLPECFNCPYSNDCFRDYSEEIPASRKGDSPSVDTVQEIAKEHGIYLVAGSIPEIVKADDKIYNTSIVCDPNGEIIAKHRKMHLFDIDVPGKIRFIESKTLSAGNTFTTFKTKWATFGLAICYDMRFPELAQIYAQEGGAEVLLYPGAFNTTTGPAHWELLQRARAVDNQVFVATASPARDVDFSYQAWGHSTIVSPWGEILATTDEKPGIVMSTIDINRLHEVRQSVPVLKQKRSDLYRSAGRHSSL